MVHQQVKINALTVCVNYSDWLKYSLPRWNFGASSLTVVTDMRDIQTAELVSRYPGVKIHPTDTFYSNGAMFNKGAAMEEARRKMPWSDWILFFDADIVPEYQWHTVLSHTSLDPTKLYGAKRYQARDVHSIDDIGTQQLIPDAPCDGGYFHLFHSSTIKNQTDPLLETIWSHAGVYDSHFRMRWRPLDQVVLPVRLTHLGDRENWCGRGNSQQMRDLLLQRRVKGGYYHERITENK